MVTSRRRGIELARRIGRSRVAGAAVFLVGLVSIVLTFGFTSDVMYGVSDPVNLVMYWHIALAWTGGVALLVTFVASVQYLRSRDRIWNLAAHASGEIGFLFITGTLVMGSTWGSAIWGTWWSWRDIRLVTFFIAWLVYAGYLVVFAITKDGEGQFAAAYGAIGFMTIPISFVSTRIWQAGLHNPTIGGDVSAETVINPATLVVSIVAVTLLYVYFFSIRLRIHRLRDDVLTETETR